MSKFIKYIFIFYAMKFSPRFIDNRSSMFWVWCVNELNSHRGNGWAFYKIWRFRVRDMHSSPQRDVFYYSKLHPFVFKKL